MTLPLKILAISIGILSCFSGCRNSTDDSKEAQEFALDNPGTIDQIFLSRKGGIPITLTKKKSDWFLNDSIRVSDQKLNMLLYETAPKLSVKGPVPKTARNHVIRRMAALGTKVEFWKNKTIIKTYYVGGTTPDQLGTYMWIEGAKDPYIVHIPGFNGYLNSRYILDPNEWLSKELFQWTAAEIHSVSLEYPAHPEWSFMFTRKKGSIDVTVDAIHHNKPVNTSAVLGYFSQFNGVYCEGFPTGLSNSFKDSLKASTPFAILSLQPEKGSSKTLKIYRKAAGSNMYNLYDDEGNQILHDPERFYAIMEGDPRILYIQELVFKNILIHYTEFLLPKN